MERRGGGGTLGKGAKGTDDNYDTEHYSTRSYAFCAARATLPQVSSFEFAPRRQYQVQDLQLEIKSASVSVFRVDTRIDVSVVRV